MSDKNEVTNSVLNFFKNSLNLNFRYEDIVAAHPLPMKGRPPGGNHPAPPPTILVKFLRENDKGKVIRERRKLKGKTINIQEDLTRKNQALLNRVRHDNNVETAWFSRGRVWCIQGGRRFRVHLNQSVSEAARRGERAEWRPPQNQANFQQRRRPPMQNQVMNNNENGNREQIAGAIDTTPTPSKTTITDRLCYIAGIKLLPVLTSTTLLNTAAPEQEEQRQQPQHPQSQAQASSHLHQQDLQTPHSAPPAGPPSTSAVGNQPVAPDSENTLPWSHDMFTV